MIWDGRAAALDAARRASDQMARDSAKNELAISRNVVDFTGNGQADVDIAFNVKFTDEPTFVVGNTLLRPPDLKTYRMPQATAFVTAWKRDSQGLFVGAKVTLSVHVPEAPNIVPAAQADPHLQFHLACIGVAYKDGEFPLQATAYRAIAR